MFRFFRVAVLLSLCSVAAFAADPVLVQGAGVVVTASDVLADAQRMPPEIRKATLARPDNVAQIGSNLYLRRALAADAEREGLGADPAVVAALQIARDRVLSEARLARLDAANTPSDAALDALASTTYKANPKRFDIPEQVRARHLLVDKKTPDARAQAEKLLADLKGGADFAALAKEHSADPGSAAKGGDLGFFGRGRMVPAFDDAVFALKKPGDRTGLVETEFGFHIIQLEAVRAGGARSFEEVREALRKEILAKIINDGRAREQTRVMDAARPDKAAIDAFAASAR